MHSGIVVVVVAVVVVVVVVVRRCRVAVCCGALTPMKLQLFFVLLSGSLSCRLLPV